MVQGTQKTCGYQHLLLVSKDFFQKAALLMLLAGWNSWASNTSHPWLKEAHYQWQWMYKYPSSLSLSVR